MVLHDRRVIIIINFTTDSILSLNKSNTDRISQCSLILPNPNTYSQITGKFYYLDMT